MEIENGNIQTCNHLHRLEEGSYTLQKTFGENSRLCEITVQGTSAELGIAL